MWNPKYISGLKVVRGKRGRASAYFYLSTESGQVSHMVTKTRMKNFLKKLIKEIDEP